MPFLHINMTQVVEILPQVRQGPTILHSQYHGCWCSGDARSQGISNHDFDLVKPRWLGPCTLMVKIVMGKNVTYEGLIAWCSFIGNLSHCKPCDAIWRQKSGSILGSGNGLLPDSNKPLPEPILTTHKWGPVSFIWEQFWKRYLSHQSPKFASKLLI